MQPDVDLAGRVTEFGDVPAPDPADPHPDGSGPHRHPVRGLRPWSPVTRSCSSSRGPAGGERRQVPSSGGDRDELAGAWPRRTPPPARRGPSVVVSRVAPGQTSNRDAARILFVTSSAATL
ncbi:hypothetical protein GCM10009528_47330 [Kineococcus aurantiacus]